MAAGLRITGRGSPGARLGASVQETVDKKTDLFAARGPLLSRERWMRAFLFRGAPWTAIHGSTAHRSGNHGHRWTVGKKTDLFRSGQGPGNPRTRFDSALRAPASPA
jgi:hypothetical protein